MILIIVLSAWYALVSSQTQLPRNPFERIEAESFIESLGGAKLSDSRVSQTKYVGRLTLGNRLVFRHLNFDLVAQSMQLHYSSPKGGCQINFRLDSYQSQPFLTFTTLSTNLVDSWALTRVQFPNATQPHGIHDLYVTIDSAICNELRLDFFIFCPDVDCYLSHQVKSAFEKIEAESYDFQEGTIESFGYAGTSKAHLGWVEPGDNAVYSKIDFKTGAKDLKVHYSNPSSTGCGSGNRKCFISFHLGSKEAEPFVRLFFTPTGPGWGDFKLRTATIDEDKQPIGVHDVFVKYGSDNYVGGLAGVDWFQFSIAEVSGYCSGPHPAFWCNFLCFSQLRDLIGLNNN